MYNFLMLKIVSIPEGKQFVCDVSLMVNVDYIQ